MKIPRSVGIHDGTFHADEVTACALLIAFGLVDIDKIVRTRDPKALSECEYVCDVGGVYEPRDKLFDHHQSTYQGELSSAGMVLHYFKEIQILTEEEFHFFNQTLILGVDAHDNGRAPQILGMTTFSHVIANFNPASYEADHALLDAAFKAALQFTLGHVQRLHGRYLYNQACGKVVEKAMAKYRVCLFFDEPLAWLENFFALGGKDHPALFVIMPAQGHWKLRGIPPDYERRMQVRLPLPQGWAGLLEDELKKSSGIPGAVFCHKGRFTSVWETKEDAIKALKAVLEMNGMAYENSF